MTPGQEPGSAEVQPSPGQKMIPPNFTEPVKSVEAVDGQELRIPCKVTGTPMPQISWYHNGKNIDQDEEYVVTYNPDTGDVSLLIVEVFPEDEGEYVCVAHNPAGDAVTRATLVVSETEEVLKTPTKEETEVKVTPEAPEKKVEVMPEECLPEAAEIEEDEVTPAVIERPKVVPLQEEKPASPTFEIEVGYIPVEEDQEMPPEIEEQAVESTIIIKPAPKFGPDEVKEAEVQPDVIPRPKVVPLEETKPELPPMEIEIEAFVPAEVEEKEQLPPEVEEQVVEPEKLVRPTPIFEVEAKEAELKPDIIERPKVVPLEETKAELPSMEVEIEAFVPTEAEREELPPQVEEQIVEPEKLVRPTPKFEAAEVTEAQLKPDIIERPKVVPLEETKAELPSMDIEVEAVVPTEEEREELPPQVEEEVVEPERIVKPTPKFEPAEAKEEELKPDLIERPKVVPLEETKPELPPMQVEFEIQTREAPEQQESLPDEVSEEVLEQTVKITKIERPKPKPLVEEAAPEEPDFEVQIETKVEEKPEVGEEVSEEALVPDLVKKKVDIPELKPKDEDMGKKKARDDEERPPKKEEIYVPEQFEAVEEIDSAEEIPPEFVELMQPQIVYDGDRAVLSTKVIGVPPPSITWYKGTTEIQPSTDFQIGYDVSSGVCTLLIPEVFPEDAGEYACRAVNPYGESVTTANLLVEGKPYYQICGLIF